MTTVWRKVATAADAGSTVRVSTGTTYIKAAVTLAAYRGTDTTNPVASITGAGEPGSAADAHVAVRGQQHERRVATVVLVGQEQLHVVVDRSGGRAEPGHDGRLRRWTRRQPADRLARTAHSGVAGKHRRPGRPCQRRVEHRDDVDHPAAPPSALFRGPPERIAAWPR